MSRSLALTSLLALAGVLIPFSSIATQPPASNANQKASPFAQGPDRDIVVHVCTPCHAPEQVTAKHHTADEWDSIIGRMLDRGAQANEADQDRILTYLVRFYGP